MKDVALDIKQCKIKIIEQISKSKVGFMLNYTLDQLLGADLNLYSENPVINPVFASTVVADPSMVSPKDSPDGLMHLFCHSFYGIEHFSSRDGINFDRQKRVAGSAMRPNINLVDGTYYLYYEKTLGLLSKALSLVTKKWQSKIVVKTSPDLVSWSGESDVITCTHDYHKFEHGVAISNPFLTKFDDKFRLYYSSGQTYIEDCHFSEPTHISYAESDSPVADFVSTPIPIISPDPKSKYTNLCSGCLKVYRIKDGIIGLQNGIYEQDGKSYSAIMLLFSTDGIVFEYKKHILMPGMCGDNDWMRQYVYACELVEIDGDLRLYFNARDKSATVSAREKIGFLSIKTK